MKIILPALCAALFCSSCFKYQYYSIAADRLVQNEKNEFVHKTDSLIITYNFQGENGPVSLTIENKSAKALSVDWERSQLIRGDQAEPLYPPQSAINGQLSLPGDPLLRPAVLSATSQATPGRSFMPPGTRISLTCKALLNPGYADPRTEPVQKIKTRNPDFTARVRQKKFTRTESPFTYRIYLSFLRDDGTRFATDEPFYSSGWVATKTDAATLYDMSKAGNLVVVSRATGGGKTAFAVAGTTLLAGLVIVGLNDAKTGTE